MNWPGILKAGGATSLGRGAGTPHLGRSPQTRASGSRSPTAAPACRAPPGARRRLRAIADTAHAWSVRRHMRLQGGCSPRTPEGERLGRERIIGDRGSELHPASRVAVSGFHTLTLGPGVREQLLQASYLHLKSPSHPMLGHPTEDLRAQLCRMTVGLRE